MANQKISELTALTGANVQPTIDQIPIVDSSVTTTKKITPEQLLIGMGVTATATELNTLDGITASTAELNIMDGVTASTAEINQLDDNTFDSQVNVPSIVVSGTNGSGHADLRWQASNPTAGGNHTALWADADGDINIKKDGGSVLQLATTDEVALKVTANSAITGATKTKVTYDSKGLVTSGADATTADIADSSNKRYVTDAQLTVIGNTSGTNTGDQNIFQTIAVSGQSNVVADSTTDILTLVAGANVTITTNAGADSITIAASGSGGTEIQTSTATGVQTNLNTSAATSKNTVTVFRWTPGSMAILQSIDTTGWEDGKMIRIVNATSQSGTNGRLILIENENGASGTKMSYPRNGVPLMLMPRDYADFSFNSSDGYLYFMGGTSFGGSPSCGFDRWTDCQIFNQSQDWLTTGMNFSDSAYETNTTKKPYGIWGANLTTSASSGFYASSRANGLIPAQGCAMTLQRVATTTALSDGTDTYIIESGFGDNNTGTPTDGAYWRYQHSAGTVWRTVTNKASAETVSDQSGFTVSTSEYPYLGVFCNSDWTNIQFFYSNDGLTWSIGNVHTTNTPAAGSPVNSVNIFGAFRKTAGSTSRKVEWDMAGYRYQFRRGA